MKEHQKGPIIIKPNFIFYQVLQTECVTFTAIVNGFRLFVILISPFPSVS